MNAEPFVQRCTIACENRSALVEPGDGVCRSATRRLSGPASTRPAGVFLYTFGGSDATLSASSRTQAHASETRDQLLSVTSRGAVVPQGKRPGRVSGGLSVRSSVLLRVKKPMAKVGVASRTLARLVF